MSQLDTFFRAVEELRKRTSESGNERQLKRIMSANPDSDRIEVVKNDCKIEKDWIEAIEAGLVHIEKAINEERQFIRSNGEVVPIEKVKQVSRESVEHLARHSNLLTRETEREDVIPDKLYTVERLTDYAVYENKFLYMLLCYLRDFVSYRYEKICELTNTYSGSLQIKKDIRVNNSVSAVEIKLNERIINDDYISAHNPVKDEIDRIDLILKTVVMLLSTPLMEAVSKSPVLKPPITETNVLKMNKNFKGAKELYYFLAAYDRDGFEVVQRTEVISPFKNETAADFAEVIALLSFLTYEHGLGLRGELKENLEQTLKREEEEKQRELKQKINNLKKRIEETGRGAEEYMLLLEQLNRSLENDVAELAAAKAEIEKLNSNIAKLQGDIQSLNTTISTQTEKAAKLAAAHEEELKNLTAECARRMQAATDAHAEELEKIAISHTEELEQINSAHAQEIEEINATNAEKSEDMERRLQSEIAEKTAAQKAAGEVFSQFGKLQQDKLLLEAKLNAVKKQCGLDAGDFTSEDKFDELEKQYNALKALFKEEWKKSKKKIRREILKPENTEKSPSENEPKSEE